MGEIAVTPLAYDGVAPEAMIARDIVKRALMVAPILIVAFGLIWGVNGALSTAYGLAIVVANFVLAAAMLAWAGRISTGVVMAAALFGYLIRLTLIFLAIWLVRKADWVELVPLGITIIGAHLGLLFWEMKYVSLSLAFPGVKPTVVTPESPASKESSSQ
jgi:hypothetical protein